MFQLFDYVALAVVILVDIYLILGVKHKQRRVRILAYTVATLVFILHLADIRLYFLWVWLLPHPSVVVVRSAAVWGPIIAILIGLSQHLPNKRDVRALKFIAVLVGLYGAYIVLRQLIPPGEIKDATWLEGTLIQSTGSTCIAAACSTYLDKLGYSLSEEEAVKLGLISTYGGTTTNAWRILRMALPAEYDVHIAQISKADAIRTGQWYVAATKLDIMTGHEVVFRSDRDTRQVLVLNPLGGEYTYSWDEFEDEWIGSVVWAERSRKAR